MGILPRGKYIHTSWLIMWLAVGFCLGVAALRYNFDFIYLSLGWLASGLLLLIIGLLTRTRVAVFLVILAGVMLGLWRGGLAIQQSAEFYEVAGQPVVLSGEVIDVPNIVGASIQAFKIKNILIDEKLFESTLDIETFSKLTINKGDIVTVKGQILYGERYDYATMKFATVLSVVSSEKVDSLIQLKSGFSGNVRKYIDEPGASLGLGFVLGQKTGLPITTEEYLRIAGLSHVIVASGYNFTILVRFTRRLFYRLSKYLAALGGFLMIFGFVSITGAGPSLTRAAIVASLSLLAWYYGRKFNPFVLLFIAAAITLLINPAFAWGDLGWQLSFVAFAGVMIVAPIINAYFFGDKSKNAIRQIGIETFSAFLVTAPLLALTFSVVSNVAIITNILVLPFVPIVMLLIFIVGLLGFVLPLLAQWLGHVAQIILDYQLWVSEYFASLPWAQTNVKLSIVGVFICYVVIILVCIYMKKASGFDLKNANVIE